MQHYFRWYRTGDPGEVDSTYGTRTCRLVGCDAPHRARGWCVEHYRRFADPRACRRRDCPHSVKARGLCCRHYDQLWRLGLVAPHRERHAQRNESIRAQLARGVPVPEVAVAAGLSPARIYQIRARARPSAADRSLVAGL